MKWNNVDSIDLFDRFKQEYEEIVNAIFGDASIDLVNFIGSNNPYAGFLLGPQDYFKSNNDTVAYHEENCNTIGFGENEKFAIIAHELGHILHRADNYNDNHLLKEMDADFMAVSLGLTESLIDGLTIFLVSGNCGEGGDEQMQLRINALQQHL